MVTIELESNDPRDKHIKRTKYVFVALERFISNVVEEHGEHPVSTDGGTWYPPQVCRFLKLGHHIHSFVYKDEKSIIERTMQYIKDRTMDASMITFLVERRNVN